MKDEVMKMNKMKFNKILLGLTTDGEVVFANVENRDGMFSASFEMVEPFEWNDEEAYRRAESMVECIDDHTKLDLLEQFDCRPSDLVEEVAYRFEVEELVDISLYSESFYNRHSDVIYFESSSCGQVDITRYDYEFKVDEKLFSMIVDTWREYHLEQIPEVMWSRIQDLLVTYEDIINTEDLVEEWLEKSENIDIY